MIISKFEMLLCTQTPFRLPEFKGSTFRGKFGHLLKRTICIISHHKCEICEIKEQCAYPYLFETQNSRGESIARPFVLEPPLTRKRLIREGQMLYLRLILIGKAIDFLPYFVYVFQRMGDEGIGTDRGRFQLQRVRSLSASGEKQEVYDCQSRQLSSRIYRISLDDFKAQLLPQVTLQFYTPTYVKSGGQPVIHLEFPILLKAILRRYHSLNYFHGNGDKEWFAIPWELADEVEIVHQELEPLSYRRYSNRQKKRIPLEGFVGRITYRGNLTPFYPWLKIGEYLHVGKGAVFGMGGYGVLT